MSDLRAIAEAAKDQHSWPGVKRAWHDDSDLPGTELCQSHAAAWTPDRALAALDIRDALIVALNEHDAQDDLGYNSMCWCHQARAVLDKWDALG